MKSSILLFYVLLFSSIVSAQQKGKSPVLARGAKLTLLSSDFKFTEGPAADSEGNVFFTDQPNDRIMKWSEEDGITTYGGYRQGEWPLLRQPGQPDCLR